MKIVYAIIATIAIAVAGVVSMQFLTLKKTEVENEARFACAQSSRYQVAQENNTVVWYPVNELYQKCLSEKGLQ